MKFVSSLIDFEFRIGFTDLTVVFSSVVTVNLIDLACEPRVVYQFVRLNY